MKSVVELVDVMKVSDEESILLTGAKSYEQAAEEILAMGPKLVAVTLGEQGVLMAAKNSFKSLFISLFSIGTSERAENIAMIAAYMDYLMNLEENRGDATDNRPISKWKEFGLHKGVLRI